MWTGRFKHSVIHQVLEGFFDEAFRPCFDRRIFGDELFLNPSNFGVRVMTSWPVAFNEVKPCVDLLIAKVIKKNRSGIMLLCADGRKVEG